MIKNPETHSIANEIKSTYLLGMPLIASQLIYALSGFIGTAMVAHLGKEALAASVLVSVSLASLATLFFGLLNATGVLVAHQYGAKNNAAISEVMGQAYQIGALICIPMLAMLCSLPYFLTLTEQSPAVLTIAREYAYALLWTIPGLVALLISEQFLAGIGKAKIILHVSIMIVPIEIFLIYVLVFGKLGFPYCGVAGVGYGFAITYTFTAIGLIYFLTHASHYKNYHILKDIFKTNGKRFKDFIHTGLPMGLMSVVEVTTFAATTYWMVDFGVTMLAAHQIMLQYLGITITLVFAMSQAVSVRVGHAVGRQDLPGVRYAAFIGMMLNFICVSVIALAFYLMPTLFLRLDMDVMAPANASLVKDAGSLLAIGGVLLLFDNFRIVGCGALRGMKDVRFPMIATLFSFWVFGLGSAYLFAFVWNAGGQGIWWGLTVGIATGAVIVMVRLRYMLARVDLTKIISV